MNLHDAIKLVEGSPGAINGASRERGLVGGIRNVVLTGGRTAAAFYRQLAKSPQWQEQCRHIEFYFGDERCVPVDHPDSNYRQAMEALFNSDPPEGTRIHRLEGDHPVPEVAAERYAAKLPDSVDLLMLTVGEDGHIASLFPHSPALGEHERRVVFVVGPKAPHQRVTITPRVIANAKQVVVLAVGEAKRKVYEEALRDPGDVESLPARLVLDRTWIFGDLE